MDSNAATTSVNSKQEITERLFRDNIVRGNLHLKPTNAAANLKSRSFNLPPVSHPAGKMASASKSSLISSQVTEPWSVFHSVQNETMSLTTRLGGLVPREKKISQRNDRKIVNYLRRKLHRRMNQWYNAAEYEEEEDGGDNSDVFREEKPTGRKTATDKPKDIYQQYNDIGGRISKEGDYGLEGEARRKKRSPVGSPGLSSTESGRKSPKKLQKLQSSNEKESYNEDKVDEEGATRTPTNEGLPPIESPSNSSSPINRNFPGVISPSSSPTKLPSIREPSNMSEIVLNEEEEEASEHIDDMEQLTDTLQSATLAVQVGGKRQRRKLAFSPIDTPYPVVNRNGTADLMHLDFSNTVDRVLKGHMNIKCQTQKKIISLYVSSNLSDTEAERTVLMEKVYPKLQKMCKERGYEFQVCDMSWGLRDTVTDDHSHPLLCLKELEETLEISRGPNFITLLSHMYGQCSIPHILAVEEFAIIIDAIRRDREHFQTKVMMTPSSDRPDTRPDTKGTERGGLETPKSMQKDINRKDTTNSLVVDKLMPGNKLFRRKIKSPRDMLTAKVSKFMSFSKAAKSLTGSNEFSPGPEEATDEAALYFDDSNGKLIVEQFDNDLNQLETWYKKDENDIPAVYRLLPISSQYRDILHHEKNRQQRAKGNWLAIENKLMKIFLRYSKEPGLERFRENLNTSLTEKEINKGLLKKVEGGKETSHWFKRTITDIKSNLVDNKAHEYIDLDSSKPIADQSLTLKVENLSSSIYKCIGPANIRDYSIAWHREGVNPDANRGHANYIEKMSNDVTDILTAKIENSLESSEKSFDAKTKAVLPLYNEVVQAVHFVQERSKSFYGRKDILTSIKEYVRHGSSQPLVVHGKSGNGKTSIMARAAKEAACWVKMGDPIVIARFVSLTGESTNIRLLLKSISQQLCYAFKQDSTTIPEDFHGVMNDLSGRLLSASSATPVVIFIDSLDQLTDEYNARSLLWLPRELPPHVRLIVSTLPEEQYTCFKELNKMFESKDNFVEVPDLPENDALFILEHLFKATHRTTTLEQHDAIFNAFKQCPTPFYLKMAFNESCLWTSYSQPKDTKLANSAFKLVNAFYVRLEMNHGDALVRRALGHITAAKNGVTHNELMDLLSLDDTVLDEAAAVSSLPLRRFPPVLWCRLRRDLGSYLVERSAHGVWTYRWYHKIFHDVAVDRYLENRDKAPSYHSALGEYFLGTWANRKKPFTGNENGAIRYVSEQPLCYNPESSELEQSKTFFNLRKLNELPHHLINSNQFENLKLQVLLNYEWTLAKLRSVSLRSVLDDLQAALAIEPNDKELKLVSDTLQLSSDVLSRDPAQFGSQLVGRLQTLVMNDKPASMGDPKKYPNLPQMLAMAHKSSVMTLIPSMSCLTEPGDVLHDLLAGHTDIITAVTTTTDGYVAVTASRNNTIKVWDLRYRKVTRTIEKTGREVNNIRMCSNNTIAATSDPYCIRLWSLRRSCSVGVIDQFIDPATITVAGTDWQYLVAFYSGSNVMRTWDVDNKNGYKMIVETTIETDGVHKDQSICVSLNCNREKVLHASRGGKQAFVRNAKDGSLVFELPANGGDGACITATGISTDYYILCCRYQYMKLSEIYHLELFDNRDGKFSRFLKGCTQDSINEIYVNKLGSHILCLSSSYQTETTEFATWNMESEDHRHYARHAQMSTMGACVDLSYCLTASKQSNSLRIWNMTKRINERSEGDGDSRFGNKKKQGLEALLPMKDNPRYVIAKGANNGPLCVWNVVKGKCAGKPVHIERGLSEAQDISLVKNNKVIILCDRGMSSLSDEPSEVFQTVKIYNLKTNRFEKSKKNVFIVPSPPREYKLLGKDMIMGLNEDRDHLVIWNLITGHVVARIKTKFKEMERQQRTKLTSNTEEREERRRKMRRNGTAQMTPWERRSETNSARTRRKEREDAEDKHRLEEFKKEKENAIEQYMISGDEKVIVCSYFAHHMCVFNVDTREHTQTLENQNSMLYLHNAALTQTGSHLAHANYDDEEKVSYLTLWDLETGEVRRRLKNESNVCCIAITSKADRVVFGNEQNTLKVWDPLNRSSLRKIRGYPGLKLGVDSKLFVIKDGERAVLFSGDISLWDLNKGTSLATFTPDIRIQCVEVVMEGELIIFGLSDQTNVVSLQLRGKHIKAIEVDENQGEEMFGETTGDTSDEGETEDEDGAEK